MSDFARRWKRLSWVCAALWLGGASVCAGRQAPAEAPAQPPAEASPQPAPATPPSPADTASEDEADEAPQAVVELKDGQVWTGTLVKQDGERVVLRISGITTIVPRAEVRNVFIPAPVMEQYRTLRADLDDSDTASLLGLAEWLRERGKLVTALREIDEVLKREPENAAAKRLRLQVEEQKRLRDRSRQRAPGEAPAIPPPGSKRQSPFPLLSPEQVNLIKVYEVDLADPPKMLIGRDTITRLMDLHAGDPLIPPTREGREAVHRMPPPQILDLMYRLQARPFYGEVRILDHPKSMKAFRNNVHETWLMRTCATFHCHGGEEAGRLWLYTRSPNSDATVYTNFLILDRFRLKDDLPLIDYEEPQRSPLLQMGLPREDAIFKHPPVPDRKGHGDRYRPPFQSTDDRRFREAVEWIKMMYRPRPDYPIAYRPPVPAGAIVPNEAKAPKER